MAGNRVQPGNRLTLTAPYAVASGAGLKVGNIFGVALSDAALNGTVEAAVEDVYSLAKVSAQAWAVGDLIYWDDTAKLATTSPTGNLLIGFATAVAANPSSTGNVKLLPPAGAATGYTLGNSAVVTISSAELLALNATPKQIIAAPGANLAIIPRKWLVRHAGGTAYAGIAAGEDLSLKYTDGSGAKAAADIETTGFLDQVTAQIRTAGGISASVAPVANAAVVAHLLSGEIITGDFDLEVLVYYDVVPTNFAGA